MIDVRVHATPEVLGHEVASAFLDLVARPPVSTVHEIALTGGSIADRIHQEIAVLAPLKSVQWQTVRFWWGDERFVAADSPDRNAAQARAALLDRLLRLRAGRLPAEHVMEVPSSDAVADVEAAAAAYADLLRHAGSGELDLVMLGIGPDGHVASLFPGRPELEVHDTVAVAVHDSPKPPPQRVSLTFEALNRSRAVWFIASGEEKAAAVARSVAAQRSREGSVGESPAYGIGHPDHLRPGAEPPAITWWLDEAAASSLP